MRKEEYGAIADVFYRISDGPIEYGRTAFLTEVEKIVESLADIFAAADSTFDRAFFCTRAGFPMGTPK